MLVKLVSDIHTEFYQDDGKQLLDSIPNENVDVLVVAGDLSTGWDRIKSNLRQLCDRFPNVVYCLGNHDHWHSSIDERTEQILKLGNRYSNLHCLENTITEINGQRFIGGTLWFKDPQELDYKSWIDYRKIADGAEAIHARSDATVKFLEQNVQQGDIVVTHHLPSNLCIHPRWKYSEFNVFFVREVDHIILGNKPAFWFFGHTHDTRHLTIGDTEMICNPMGYPHEGVVHNHDLIIDTNIEKRYA